MALTPSLTVTQKQQLKLTPQLIQSFELMTLPLAELQQRIKEEIATNPALEIPSTRELSYETVADRKAASELRRVEIPTAIRLRSVTMMKRPNGYTESSNECSPPKRRWLSTRRPAAPRTLERREMEIGLRIITNLIPTDSSSMTRSSSSTKRRRSPTKRS